MADDKLYKSEYIGSGTFIINPKKAKQRQSNLKNVKTRLPQVIRFGQRPQGFAEFLLHN